MKRLRTGVMRTIIALTAAPGLASLAQAQSAGEFYRGKVVRLLIGYGPGTGDDLYARSLARHMEKHIPGNPQVVPQNMPGAGGMTMLNHLYNAAARDGTYIGLVRRNLLAEPLFGTEQAKFEALKFTWLGSMSQETALCSTWRTTGVKTLEDAKQKEVLVGSTGQASGSFQFPILLNVIFGTRFKPLLGYPDSSAIGLAMERGELHGYCSFTLSAIKSARPQWLSEKQINILAQLTTKKHPALPDVPLILDMTDDPAAKAAMTLVFADQEIGRPVAGPPDLPKDRAEALRAAFMATMKDPAFLDEAERAGMDIDGPVDGPAVQAVLKAIYASPPEAVEKVIAIRDTK
jgi:tripartite-type tricarboxylate transporter receptor subunit TctC